MNLNQSILIPEKIKINIYTDDNSNKPLKI